MNNDQTPVKKIIAAIEEYYKGMDLQEICDAYEISQDVFHNWLAEYSYIAAEIMELKLENEQLRKLADNLREKLGFSAKVER